MICIYKMPLYYCIFSTFEWDMSSIYWIHRLVKLHVIGARRIRNVFIIRPRWRLRFQNNSLHVILFSKTLYEILALCDMNRKQHYLVIFSYIMTRFAVHYIRILFQVNICWFLLICKTCYTQQNLILKYFSSIFDNVRTCVIQITSNDSLTGHLFVSLGSVNHFSVLITSHTNASCVLLQNTLVKISTILRLP